ncbi:putative glycosidase crf2 [Talaromyces atroroseus]|uniref:Crh-like protein n=1 Tax=Talaromyces atroroseus TaxID=1441469 RepID=A0A225A966_TALAT|nr:putative glycosidase crf2 [Talaromyces atroroseus]OKL57252.1 putative glycosidase crf2 [Talaromyces atroroseus]
MVRLIQVIAAAVTVAAVTATTTCSADSHCPEEAPCCSEYGECGVGEECLLGCNPILSYALDSCAPQPVCESKSFSNWTTTDEIIKNWEYLGNATANDWWVSGTPLVADGNLLLTMAANTTGTLLSSTHYVWYGKISVTMKTSRGSGVVTAFVMMSDVLDEIDTEFIGSNLTTAQTNYFFQGIVTGELEVNASMSDSFENFHTYALDWTPDSLTWLLDDEPVRVLNRSTTYNATTMQYMYPQTPSRVELSIWPGGASDESAGVIAWAGGAIDWNSTDIQEVGYDYATIKEVNITCYDPPSGANIQGNISYIYTNDAATNNTVEITNNSTVMASFEDTGTNMTAGATTAAAQSTATSSSTSDSGSSESSSSSSSSSSGDGFSQGNGSGSNSSIAVTFNPSFIQVSLVLAMTTVALMA